MTAALSGGLGLSADRRYEVRFFSRRGALLEAIAEDTRPALAFIDLQREESVDTAYAGHRLIETIRRHPRLAHCRPLAYTAYAYGDVVALVHKHGGYGLVSRYWNDKARRSDLELLRDQLDELLNVPERAPADQDDFLLRTGVPSADPLSTLEESATSEVFTKDNKWFLEPSFWALMRHLAHPHVGQTAAIAWVQAEFQAMSVSGYEKRVERLTGTLASEFQIPSPDLRKAALRLLELVPHRRAAPDEQVSLKHLARVRGLHPVLPPGGTEDPTGLLAESWLDEEAITVLRQVIDQIPLVPTNHDQHLHTAALEKTLRSLDPASEGQSLVPPLIRAVNGILDTFHERER